MTDLISSSENSQHTQKCGFIAIIGAPNAGKSSLVNAMCGAKVSIVSHKVQTTRTRVRGVAMVGEAQLVFIDTPGIFAPRRRLDRAMVAAAWEGLDGADITALLVDAPSYIAAQSSQQASPAARHSRADTDRIIEVLRDKNHPAILIINKIDKIARERLLALTQELNDAYGFEETFFVSATRGDGMDYLKEQLAAKVPAGPYMYPEDQLSDITDRLMAAEITREKIFLRLHQELPYDITVETEQWERQGDGALRIEQTVYVNRDGQKGIVLGKAGQTLKAIGAAAREEMQTLFDCKVHLFLHVKVRENWADDPARYRQMGLDFVD